MSPFLPCRQLSDFRRNDSRRSRYIIETKPAKDVEKNAYIHFVDERDFKEVSVVGKRKSKKNRAVGSVLTAVSAEVQARTTKSKATAVVKSGARALSLMKNTEEGSCSPEEFSENV